MAKQPDACPKCGSREVTHIIFGMPTPQLMSSLEPWEELAGCVVGQINRRCAACGHQWGTGRIGR